MGINFDSFSKKEKDIPSDMKAYKEDSEARTMNGKYNHGFIAQEVLDIEKFLYPI